MSTVAGVESSTHAGAGNGLHQFTDFRFQKFVGDDHRLERGVYLAAGRLSSRLPFVAG
jgi:hypothetical protein